jgi:hypothetical protein
MMLGGLGCVVGRVLCVPVRYVGMMTGFLVVSTFVVGGSLPMMFRCVLVVLRGGEVVFCAFMFHFLLASR